MSLVNICIPTYEMHALGKEFLKKSFDVLCTQTFKDFEIIISDHSQNNDIKDLCEEYVRLLNIKYYKNTEKIGNSSANINNAIKKATGQIIKILFQDDFLYSKTSLEDIVKNFDLQKDHWLVTACTQTKDGVNYILPFYPHYNDKIHIGRNTISSPSVLTIKREGCVFFDENLIQRMDCDYYKRCYDSFGQPKILNTINVVNRIGPHQITNTRITEKLREREYQYLLKKYNEIDRRKYVFLKKIKNRLIEIKKKIY